MKARNLFCAALCACVTFAGASVQAATAAYEYDALGRLRAVDYDSGQIAIYDYDDAGNRIRVVTGTKPGAPSSITVPTSSTTGSYTISWGAATGTVTAYQLYEATNSGFSGETAVYTGSAQSVAVSGRAVGTYYYRVRACISSKCYAALAGANGVTVIPPPPGVPSSITVPTSSSTGSYSISWGSASGTVTRYELYESTSSSFSSQTQVYNGTGLSAALSGRTNGTYNYRARACSATECSAYVTGSAGVTVSIPPPPTIQVLNPAISVGTSGQTTSISTLANLNGIPATISSFTETCTKATVVIQSGAQSVAWTNNNTFLRTCEPGVNQQCSASYVIRNSNTGTTHSGTSAITIVAQGTNLGPGQSCP